MPSGVYELGSMITSPGCSSPNAFSASVTDTVVLYGGCGARTPNHFRCLVNPAQHPALCQRPYHIHVSMFCRYVHRSPSTGIRFLLVGASSLQPPCLSGIAAPCRLKHRRVHVACIPRGQTRQWVRELRQQDAMKPQDNLSLAWVTGGMNGLSYMVSSVVFVYIGCIEHRPPVHCNATPLEVPGLGPWEMCHTTSIEHTLPSTFSVSGNVHAPPITRQTPRPQHASLPEKERGCPAINTAHHACTPLRYARTCECGSVHHRPCRTLTTLSTQRPLIDLYDAL